MKEIKVIIVTLVVSAGLFLCVTMDNRSPQAKVVPPPQEYDTLQQCFEYLITIERYDHALDILGKRNPAAAREFNDILYHETE